MDARRHVGFVGQIGSSAREVWGKAGGGVKGHRQRGTWAWGVRNVQVGYGLLGTGLMVSTQRLGWIGIFLFFEFFLGALRFDRDWIDSVAQLYGLFIAGLFSILD